MRVRAYGLFVVFGALVVLAGACGVDLEFTAVDAEGAAVATEGAGETPDGETAEEASPTAVPEATVAAEPTPEPTPEPLPVVEITALVADAPGDDQLNLNGEVVVLTNTGEIAVDLTGWSVSDAQGNVFVFEAGPLLQPAGAVELYSGRGPDTATERYWRSDAAIWNNAGDTAELADPAGEVVSTLEHTG